MLLAGPLVAGVLARLIQVACPLYVTGRRTGFCNYQEADLLGGWVSGVIVAFLFDTWFVAGLLFVSARQALRMEDAMDPKWRALAAGTGRGPHLPS
jgi:hypothetical protein